MGDFDWRTRSTGGYFAGIKNAVQFQDIIGVHLLKSEVCYAGSEYAITLALFNTDRSIYYLNLYLDYYLKKPELYFDQGSVITALKYLDEINNTNYTKKHLKNWENLIIWRNEKQIENLNDLRPLILDKSPQLQQRFQEIKPMNSNIDISDFHKSIESLKKIVNG